jgi:hypothetical protein
MTCRYAVGLAVVLCGTGQAFAQDKAPSYTKDVRPFLNAYCVECHRSGNVKGGANLESYESIMKGGKKGRKLLVAGQPDDSRIVTTTEGKARPNMPPRTAKKKPADKEIAVLRAWVAAGAKDDTPAGARLEAPPAVAEPVLLASPAGRPATDAGYHDR